MTGDELNALPVGAVVIPSDSESWPAARTIWSGWRKTDPPGPNGPWRRVDESDGVVTTRTSALVLIGVKLLERNTR